MAVLKVNVDFLSLVDWSGRHEDSRGRSETDETPQTRSVEEARRSPAEPCVPGTEINNQV
ncbi:hypothetical protein HNR53_002230 [Bacillus benzoevorans]|uniref:Uncharacterized protein n=1 Tax=Bacillus benzoevorans TaxID=1456 RepID=A0A7X0HU52_9BACI|nr:hypothetical protein [Bacillus benzoevorans]